MAPSSVDFLIDNWFWLAAALISGAGLLWPMLGGGGSAQVSAQEAVQLINREKAIVVDVSTAEEFAACHVPGSRHLPLAEIGSGKGLPGNKTQPLVLVCASGMRANRAVATLAKMGHERVHVLRGGLGAWREASLPLEKSA